MGYDWKKLEREESERHDRVALTFGLSWIAVGIVGALVKFLLVGSIDLIDLAIWVGIGLVSLVPAAVVRGRRGS